MIAGYTSYRYLNIINLYTKHKLTNTNLAFCNNFYLLLAINSAWVTFEHHYAWEAFLILKQRLLDFVIQGVYGIIGLLLRACKYVMLYQRCNKSTNPTMFLLKGGHDRFSINAIKCTSTWCIKWRRINYIGKEFV